MSYTTLFSEYTSNFNKISGDYDKLVAEAHQKKEDVNKEFKKKFQDQLKSDYEELKKTHDVIDDVMKDAITDFNLDQTEEFEVKHMFDVKSLKYVEPVEFVNRYIVQNKQIQMMKVPPYNAYYVNIQLIVDNYMNIYIPSLKLYIVNSYISFSKFCLSNVNILSNGAFYFDVKDYESICQYLMPAKYQEKYVRTKRMPIFLEKIGITKNLTSLRNFSLLEKKFVEAINMIKETKQKLKNVRETITKQ